MKKPIIDKKKSSEVDKIAYSISSYYYGCCLERSNMYDERGLLKQKYYDHQELSFDQSLNYLKGPCTNLKKIMYYPTTSKNNRGSIVIWVNGEDIIINIFYDAITGKIQGMNSEVMNLMHGKSHIKISGSKTEKLINDFRNRMRFDNAINLEEMLQCLKEIDVEDMDIDYSNITNSVNYREYLLKLIDSVYKRVSEYISLELPEVYSEYLRQDFSHEFGYSPEMIEKEKDEIKK